ncbi:hypothetical protein TWF481_006569 [Arthrobotrys musiformis]|uniref:Uncharacterized protein n=1 Tax=Arthrobotrys musiformis TaxID=47236 RepID=A0AAV9W8W1_9PEZI
MKMSPITSQLSALFSKLTAGNTKQTAITQEDEDILSTLFSKRILTMFSHRYLLTFKQISSNPPVNESGEKDFTENDDKVIFASRKKAKEYEKMNGRIFDAGKLERCLVEVAGFEKKFIKGYVQWKRASCDMEFDGAHWSEEWIGEVGGVDGAFGEILANI